MRLVAILFYCCRVNKMNDMKIRKIHGVYWFILHFRFAIFASRIHGARILAVAPEEARSTHLPHLLVINFENDDPASRGLSFALNDANNSEIKCPVRLRAPFVSRMHFRGCRFFAMTRNYLSGPSNGLFKFIFC